jgi:Spy/CpxP family protein refolding chaperone
MKPFVLSLALGLAAASTTLAEPPPPQAPPSAPAGKPEKPEKSGKGEKAKDRLQKLKTELALTDDQAAKMEQIMKDNQDAMRAIRDDASLSKEQKMEKGKALRSEIDSKMAGILTPEQKANWDQTKKDRPKQKDKPTAP